MTQVRSLGTDRVGLGQMLLPHHLSHRTTPELETPWPTCRHRARGRQGIMACPPFDFMEPLGGIYWSHYGFAFRMFYYVRAMEGSQDLF